MNNGRVWLITGSTSGFGRALVDAVLARGERVVATARRVEALSDVEGENVLTVALDVTREGQIAAALDAAVERFGRVDVVVNNAGIGFVGALEEMSMADLRDAMEVMFFGPAALTRAAIPLMRSQGSGTIVQISSMGGQIAGPGGSAYASAKFALEGLSEAVAGEVAPFGIRLMIVEPGSFRTGLLSASLRAAPPLEPYAETVGATRAFFDDAHGKQAGDPAKAAAAILTAVDSEEPPLRLALGADAVDGLRAKHASLEAELSQWEDLARTTAFDR
jgi:NAD(P)-dependent dehydrogenase (short-subunit alcohol dehydrogenase family)